VRRRGGLRCHLPRVAALPRHRASPRQRYSPAAPVRPGPRSPLAAACPPLPPSGSPPTPLAHPLPAQVRGPTYLKDRKKIPGGTCAFQLGAIELVALPPPSTDIAGTPLAANGARRGRGAPAGATRREGLPGRRLTLAGVSLCRCGCCVRGACRGCRAPPSRLTSRLTPHASRLTALPPGVVEHVARFLPSVRQGGAPFSIIVNLVRKPGGLAITLSTRALF
jgi:hypothetical protein